MRYEDHVTTRVTLVVPCYNEAARLRTAAYVDAIRLYPWLHLLFVDDGSRDRTRDVLAELAAQCDGRAVVKSLPANAGKAEAVRQGMLAAADGDADVTGYWDADLATPFEALPAFLSVLRSTPAIEIVIGARVQLLGRHIDRSPLRHYIGRVFATGASLALSLPVYDTQCGAKVFRRTPRIRAVFEQPFATRWIFDVELLARYLDSDDVPEPGTPPLAERIYELPLRSWVDEPGSKVKTWDGVRAMLDLVRIARMRGRRRRS